MSRSATPASTRNEATRRFETFKNDPFCRTYHRHGHMALTRTVANGWGRLRTVSGRLRTVANGWATSSEHTLNPQTPRVKREPLLRIREKTDSKTNICWMPKLPFRCIPILRRQSNIDQSFQTTWKPWQCNMQNKKKGTAKTIEKQHDVTWLQLKGVVMHYWGRCCMHLKNAIHLDKQNSLSKEEVPRTTFCASKCPGS